MKTTIMLLLSLILLAGCSTVKTELPKAEKPKTDLPKPEEPKTELSKAEEQEMLGQFAAHHQLKHRFAVQDKGEASKYYGVYGIPQIALVDQQGKVRMIKVGSGEQNARDVENSIRELLKLPPVKKPLPAKKLPPTKKPLPVRKPPLDPKKELKANPNDLRAYSNYMRALSGEFYTRLRESPEKAEQLLKEAEAFMRTIKPTEEKAQLTHRRMMSMPSSYRISIQVETTSFADLKKNFEAKVGSPSARRMYQMKASREIPSSMASQDPDKAEKKVLEEKKFLESLKAKVPDQIEDPEVAEKVALGITSLIERFLGGIERRIASARRHKELLAGGEMMPFPPLAWVNGKPLTDKDLKGKVVLLDFWAVWCGPCIATFPHLRDWHEKYSDKGLVIIGYTSYYKRYTWGDGKLVRLPTVKTASTSKK